MTALRTVTRDITPVVTQGSDEFAFAILRGDGSIETWWRVQQADGSYQEVQIRCTPALEADFAANPDLQVWLDRIRDDTHPRAVDRVTGATG